jgi:sporulation protein YlmC with PRC-barrel domain
MKRVLLMSAALAGLTAIGASVSAQETTTTPKPGDTMTKPSDTTVKPGDTMVTPTSPSPTATAPASPSSYATTQAATDWRSSKIVGLNVYNSKAEKIGEINDLIVGPNGSVSHAVVGVGGFLGMGEKNVAIPFNNVKMSRDESGKPKAMVDTTKEALQSAPTFKFYTSNS